MPDPMTEEELEELEAEARAISVWALDEADVHLLQLRRRAFAELRTLREAFSELSESEADLRERLDNAESQLALIRGVR